MDSAKTLWYVTRCPSQKTSPRLYCSYVPLVALLSEALCLPPAVPLAAFGSSWYRITTTWPQSVSCLTLGMVSELDSLP